jgi:hypothetical protein
MGLFCPASIYTRTAVKLASLYSITSNICQRSRSAMKQTTLLPPTIKALVTSTIDVMTVSVTIEADIVLRIPKWHLAKSDSCGVLQQ